MSKWNKNQFITAQKWFSSPSLILLVNGPVASGKTSFVSDLAAWARRKFLVISGLDSNDVVSAALSLIEKQNKFCSLGVRKKIAALVFEDAEFGNVQQVLAISNKYSVRVVLVTVGKLCVSGSVGVTLRKPMSSEVECLLGKEWLGLFAQTGCDLRQTMCHKQLVLSGDVAEHRTTVPVLKGLLDASDRDASNALFERYPALSADVGEIARFSDDVSMADVCHNVPEVSSIFGVVSMGKFCRLGNEGRIIVDVPEKFSGNTVGCKKRPRSEMTSFLDSCSYEEEDALRTRLVTPLLLGKMSVQACAKEMMGCGLSVDEWAWLAMSHLGDAKSRRLINRQIQSLKKKLESCI